MGNGFKVLVVATKTFHLFLDTDCYLDLFQTLYVLAISRNLVSMSKLNFEGYFFSFHNRRFSLFKNSSFVGFDSLCDSLYKLNLNSLFAKSLLTLHHNVGTKRNLINESSSYLWYKHLGHISKERMKRSMKDEIFPNLDFTNVDVCVDCIKEKQTKHTKKGATRSGKLLESRVITVVLFRLPEPSLSSRLGFQSHHYRLI